MLTLKSLKGGRHHDHTHGHFGVIILLESYTNQTYSSCCDVLANQPQSNFVTFAIWYQWYHPSDTTTSYENKLYVQMCILILPPALTPCSYVIKTVSANGWALQ